MKWKLWKKIVLGLIVLLLLVAAIYFPKIKRLSIVLSLFEPENITENFISMESIFPANKISPSTRASEFIKKDFSFPDTFHYRDSVIQTLPYIKDTETTGLLILHGDSILLENYYKGYSADQDFISWSLAKSFVSTLVGIAVQDRYIESIEDPVDKYVPILKGSGYEGVSIKDVLQMSTGILFDEDYHDFNSDINKLGRVFALGLSFDEYVASLKRTREPGTYHNYVSMDTQVLGMVVKAATKKTLSQYMEAELWQKIGTSDPAFWLKDDRGMEAAFGGLNCSLRDYARFGKLYADMGFAEGKQVVDTSWIASATTVSEQHLTPGDAMSSHPYGYGYQWWIPAGNEGEYIGMGVYNQYIYVDPKNKIVIVKNSANPNYAVERRITTYRHLYFLRALRNQVLRDN